MTEQLTLLLIRLDTNHPRTSVIGQLWTHTVFLQTRAPKYPHPHISVNDISA